MRKTARLMSVLCAALVILFFFASCFLEDLFDSDEVLDAPVIEQFKIGGGPWNFPLIEIWWNWIDGAEAYSLSRAELGSGFEDVYWAYGDTYFNDSGVGLPGEALIPGRTYQYKVRAHADGPGFSEFSEMVSVRIPAFLPPEHTTAALLSDGSVMVQWDLVEAADRYEVYRSKYVSEISRNDIATTTSEFYSDTYTFEPSTVYYYQVRAESDSYGVTDYSALVYVDTGAVTTSSWIDLGSAGFASTAGDVELASVSGVLYALFADASDVENRIKAMTHDGNDGGSWVSAGDYLSLGAADGDKVAALADGGNLYAAYADTDDTVTSGGSPRIFVKQYSGTTWSPVGSGSLGGVSTYDTDVSSEMGAYGTVPSLAISGTDLFTEYRTDSGLVDSLSYPGSGDCWIEEDSDYWITPTMISAFDTALDADSFGQPVAALQRGGTPNVPVVNLYRYDGSSWAPLGTEFDDGSGPGQMYIHGFVLDSSDVPYLAFETISSGGVNIDVSMWTGAVWQSPNLTAELTAVDTVMDLAIIENLSGTGIYSAVVFLDTDGIYKIELWEYAGGNWLQKGSSIDSSAGVTRIALELDASSRPVLVFAEGLSGALHAKGYRE